jgi:hypothetical protein
MFGWSSAATSLNTKRHINHWSVDSKTEISVYKQKFELGNVTQANVQIVVRALCNRAANQVVQDYVSDTKEWIVSAETKLASVAEYKRINRNFAELSKKSTVYLDNAQTDNSDLIVLKRHYMTDKDRPPKRLKITPVNEDTMVDEDTEITGGNEFYSVVAGQFIKRTRNGRLITIKNPEQFDLDTIIPAPTASQTKLKPTLSLSQPFQKSLQLRGHITTLVQALSASQARGDNALQNYTSPANCFRNESALREEFIESAATMANILTRKKLNERAPEFVVMEKGSDPVVLIKQNKFKHVNPPTFGRIQYKITVVDSVHTLLLKTPGSSDWQRIGTFDIDATKTQITSLTDKLTTFSDSPVVVFCIPPFLSLQDEKFKNLDIDELYDAFNTAPRLRLYNDTYTSYLSSNNTEKGPVVPFFLSDDLKVLKYDENGKETQETCTLLDKNNISFYSETILQPCIATCAKQHEEELNHVSNHCVHNAVKLVSADIPMEDTSAEFRRHLEESILKSIAAENEKKNWLLRLVPVNAEDIAWMSSHDNVIPEFTFQSVVNSDSFTWYLGGSPSPTLDVFEGALTFLNYEANLDSHFKLLVDTCTTDMNSQLTDYIKNMFAGKESSDVEEQLDVLINEIPEKDLIADHTKNTIILSVCSLLNTELKEKNPSSATWFKCIQKITVIVEKLLHQLLKPVTDSIIVPDACFQLHKTPITTFTIEFSHFESKKNKCIEKIREIPDSWFANP